MCSLILLFVLVPVVELALLLEIGRHLGVGPTLGLIVVTGTLGAFLARRQGLGVLERLRGETRAGRLPAEEVFDGVLILVAGAVLLTPGVLTDAFGFLCLVPAFRRWLRGALRRRLERAVREGRVRVHVGGVFRAPGPPDGPPAARGPDLHGGSRTIDVEAKEHEPRE